MKKIAVIGATGLVGQKLCQLLQHLPVSVRLFANATVGTRVIFRGKPTTVEPCEALKCAKIDYAMFMASNEVSAQYIPQLTKRGVVCIDNSSAFRLKKGVPLVVPCINGELVARNKLIANPNCSTVQTVVALAPLKKFGPLSLTAVTYQSVSGAGKNALDDLYARNCYGKLKGISHPIYDNIIPFIGEALGDGSTTEERKLVDESRKILSLPHLKVNSFCVRVPVSVGHGVFVNVRFKQKIDVDEAKKLLSDAPNVLLLDNPQMGLYPMPLTLRNTKFVGVGRIRRDPTTPYGLNMFTVADNLLRGAAYNALEILQCAMEEQCL